MNEIIKAMEKRRSIRKFKPDMPDNADVDFVISEDDMEILKNVERIKDYGEHGFFPVFGGKL